MSGENKGIPVGPDRPHQPKDVYGGVWQPTEPPREDKSGRGSAPRPPGAPEPAPGPAKAPREPLSFTRPEGEENGGPEISADDAGASARTQTPQPTKKPGGHPRR